MSDIQPSRNRSILESLFISPDQPRLRAGWRLLIQTLLYFLIGVILVIVAVSVGIEIVGSRVWELIIDFLAITGSVYFARRWLDKKSFESLGLKWDRQALVDVFIGIVISLMQMGFIYVAMLRLGWLTFEGFAWEIDPINVVISSALTFLVGFIFVGWNEELLSRGYHLQTIASGTSLVWGAIVSSAIFAVLHLANPNASWVSTTGLFLAGIFFAYTYIRTKQLWLPIGLHIGWNFAEGVIFGFPVSGLENIYKLIRIQVTGPEIWTGGAFGPEAGLIVLPALALGTVLIYLYTRNRNVDL